MMKLKEYTTMISSITFRAYITILAVLAFCLPSHAVPVAPISNPHVTFVNGVGAPCAGCKLSTFAAGTTTPLATYTDATGISVNTNPITLDASGGAFIWVGTNSYKFVLKDTLGATIWTVDQVNAGNLFPCGTNGAIQIANGPGTGLTCDTSITINTTNHTLNVGTLPANYVTIGALGTPTSWTFDTTSPATALASLGGGDVAPGTINQLAFYAAAGTNISGTSAIPSAITATTQAPSDNSTKLATTAYVTTPGIINPTSVQIAAGVAMTANQGDGTKIQHSTGTTTTGDGVMFDANGNAVDSGAPAVSTVKARVSFNGISGVSISDSFNIASVVRIGAGKYTITFTTPMPTANYTVSVAGTTVSGGTLVGGFIYDSAAGGSDPTTTTLTVAGIYQSGSSLLTGDLQRCDVVVFSN
jgi:hypothetical protein